MARNIFALNWQRRMNVSTKLFFTIVTPGSLAAKVKAHFGFLFRSRTPGPPPSSSMNSTPSLGLMR
jgi:hypothetical protein